MTARREEREGSVAHPSKMVLGIVALRDQGEAEPQGSRCVLFCGLMHDRHVTGMLCRDECSHSTVVLCGITLVSVLCLYAVSML